MKENLAGEKVMFVCLVACCCLFVCLFVCLSVFCLFLLFVCFYFTVFLLFHYLLIYYFPQSLPNTPFYRIGELLLLLPPLTTAGNLFIEHLHLEKLVGDTFENLVAAELLVAMGSG